MERRGGHVTGPVGLTLVAVIWGTSVGLALAHWFAFRVAAPVFQGHRPTRTDNQIGMVQVAGAIFVAAVSSLPALVLSPLRAQELTGAVPALLIGVVAYFIARAGSKRPLPALFYGITALAVGVLVALVKARLAAH